MDKSQYPHGLCPIMSRAGVFPPTTEIQRVPSIGRQPTGPIEAVSKSAAAPWFTAVPCSGANCQWWDAVESRCAVFNLARIVGAFDVFNQQVKDASK